MSRSWEIYTLSDPRTEEIRYVGITFRRRRRLTEHLSKARKGGRTHRDCWIRSLLNLGMEPIYRTIESGEGDGWQAAEREWISRYRESARLVNLTDGGEGLPGYVPTPELRQKWSVMRKGSKYAPGRVSAMKGKKHTPEARAKIATAGTGRCQSESSKEKVSKARKGKNLSPEHIEKLAAAKRGRKLSEEQRRKIAERTTGRKSVACLETGQVFASISEAARVLQVNEASVNQAIRKGCRCRGNHFRFA